MALCAIHLGNDLGNVWFGGGDGRRFFFLNFFADDLSEGTREQLDAREPKRKRLAEAYAAYRADPDNASAWKALQRWQKDLQFIFSFLEHSDELPEESFADPDGSEGRVYFGEGVSQHRWSLPRVVSPLRHLRWLDSAGESDDRRDRSAESLARPAGLLRSYRLARGLLRHLLGQAQVGDGPHYAVIGVPIGAPALSRALFHKMAREAGFAGVVLRSEAELVARHAFDADGGPAILVNLGTMSTELSFVIDEESDPGFGATLIGTGAQADDWIEQLIQQRITAETRASGKRPEFSAISRQKLFSWREACLSSLWPAIQASSDYYGEFQYPYRLRDKLTFWDVRPALESIVQEAFRRSLREPLEKALGQILANARGSSELGTLLSRKLPGALSRVIIGGSGSRLGVCEELVREAAAAGLGCENGALGLHRVPRPLEAVVDGARRYGEGLSEADWRAIAAVQEGWGEPLLDESGLATWFERWSEAMQDDGQRRALRFNLNWHDRGL